MELVKNNSSNSSKLCVGEKHLNYGLAFEVKSRTQAPRKGAGGRKGL